MKSVIVTVDTEGHVGDDPVRRLIWGETTDGKQYGIPLFMDLCDEVGAKALFFVDIAEAWHFGEEKIAEVLRYIEDRGHQTGIHIHPDHMADCNRLFLHEYSYAEQYEIIEKCTNLYEKILNKKPNAFRAGKYGANLDTLRILAEMGYRADFSEFFGQKWCGINPPVTGNQTIRVNDSLIEIPVMSYQSKLLNLINRYDKFDINATFTEQKYIFKKMMKEDSIDPIVMFGHSFSFLDWRAHPNSPAPDTRIINTFKKLLRMVAAEAQYCSLDEILRKSYLEKGTASVFKIDMFHSGLFYCFKAKSVLKQRRQIWIRNHRDIK